LLSRGFPGEIIYVAGRRVNSMAGATQNTPFLLPACAPGDAACSDRARIAKTRPGSTALAEREGVMKRAGSVILAAIGLLLIAMGLSGAAHAEKAGGTLRVTHRDSPASMSIHEEGTFSVIIPMMGVFNNLVLFDQHVPQNSLASIVPDLATSWSWDEDGTALTFTLRHGWRMEDVWPDR
jgi:hypothetical protein